MQFFWAIIWLGEKMIAYLKAVWAEFLNFIGGGAGVAHWLFFLLALFFCACMGKKVRRRVFWPSLLVLLFFFNPVFYAVIGTRFLSGVYWRLLWMLPVSFVIAFAFTQLVYQRRRTATRLLVAALACICIVLTGKRVFSRGTYSERENAYELPQAAIEIADIVQNYLADWRETLIVPNELLCYIRQYSCSACLLYGRNFGGFISDIGEDESRVYQEMCKEEPDVGLVTEIARDKNCRYIVFNTSFHRIPEDLTEYGYQKLAVVEEVYAVYIRIDG